jgi:hypothetical protein
MARQVVVITGASAGVGRATRARARRIGSGETGDRGNGKQRIRFSARRGESRGGRGGGASGGRKSWTHRCLDQ